MGVMSPFYLDENVAEGLAVGLTRLEYGAVTTAQLGRKGASDAQQLFYARETGRVLVTHNNNDFLSIHETLTLWAGAWRVRARVLHAGILVIDQGAVERGEAGVRLMVGIVRMLAGARTFQNRFFGWSRREGLYEVMAEGARLISRPLP